MTVVNLRYLRGHRPPLHATRAFICYGLVAISPMAGHGCDPSFRVAGRGTVKIETAVGVLDFPAKQPPLGGLGLARPRLGLDRIAVRPRSPQYPRSREK